MSRKTQFAWMTLGGLLGLLGIVTVFKFHEGNRAAAQSSLPNRVVAARAAAISMLPPSEPKEKTSKSDSVPDLIPPPATDSPKPSSGKADPFAPPPPPAIGGDWNTPAPASPVTAPEVKTAPVVPPPADPALLLPPPPAVTVQAPALAPVAPESKSELLPPPLPAVSSLPPPSPTELKPTPVPHTIEALPMPASPSDLNPVGFAPTPPPPAGLSSAPLPSPAAPTATPVPSPLTAPLPLPMDVPVPAPVKLVRNQPSSEPPLAPPPGPVSLYVTRGGEKLADIAKKALGSMERWPEIHRLNPTVDPEVKLAANTTVRLPADACVQDDDSVQPLPTMRPKAVPDKPKAIMPLTGTFPANLDDQKTLQLPRAIRDQLGNCDTVLITPGSDQCLWLTNQAHLDRLTDRLEQSPAHEMEVRTFKRLYYAQTEKATLNDQGRVTIPDKLAQFANLNQEVVLVGIDDHFELWDAAKWRQYTQRKSAAARAALADRD